MRAVALSRGLAQTIRITYRAVPNNTGTQAGHGNRHNTSNNTDSAVRVTHVRSVVSFVSFLRNKGCWEIRKARRNNPGTNSAGEAVGVPTTLPINESSEATMALVPATVATCHAVLSHGLLYNCPSL